MIRISVAGLIVTLLAGCGPNRTDAPPGEETGVPHQTIQEVQEAFTSEWMALPGVVGTGIGRCEDEPCIRVFLARPSPEAEEAIPQRVEGHRVELQVTGEFHPRELEEPSPQGGELPLDLSLRLDRESYSPGEEVRLTLLLENPSDEEVILEFPDAQRYDVRIVDPEQGEVWRWSSGRAFAQVLGEERLGPGDARRWDAVHEEGLPPGSYTVEGLVPSRQGVITVERTILVR